MRAAVEPLVVKDTPALREAVYARDVVVEDLKDDKGVLKGVAVIWADEHYGKRASFIVAASLFLLFFAFVFGVLALIFASEGGRGGGSSGSLAWLPAACALALLVAMVRFWLKNARPRRHDKLRSLVIRGDGMLQVPFGVPNGEKGTWLKIFYWDVTGIQLSPEGEWGGYAHGSKFYIILQTESGKPAFIGYSDRGKAELQPVIVALHNAWEKMRPFVTAHRAVASGQPIIIEDAP